MNRIFRNPLRLFVLLTVVLLLAFAVQACACQTGANGALIIELTDSGESPTNKPPEVSATEAAAVPTAAPTAAPTEAPTPEPTKPSETDGVELMEAEWLDSEGEGVRLRMVARIPKKNVDKRLMIGDFYAWRADMSGSLDEWDAIMTPSESDTTFTTAENGDMIVTFTGTMYWRRNAPTAGERITVAATGYDPAAQQKTEPSNTLTLGFGERAVRK